MAHAYGNNSTHGSSASNPIVVSFTPGAGSTVLVLMLMSGVTTNRTGGTPTFDGIPLVQADIVRTSTETKIELWYLLDPSVKTANVSIPNAGTQTWLSVIATAKAPAGLTSVLDSTAAVENQTSANPTVTITTNYDGCIIFCLCGSGATTWAPTSQDGTVIFNTDDGAFGDGEQYFLQSAKGAKAMGFVQGSDDWCIIAVAFRETSRPMPNNYQGIDVGDGLSVSEKIK